MSISILNRGASGGLTASIIVNGLSEDDTVTASDGSKTKNGVWNAKENYHEINGIKDLGLWTVTATNGEDTTMQGVLVEVIGLYEIEMGYAVNYLMLYDFGDMCEEVSGGWNAHSKHSYTLNNSEEGLYFKDNAQATSNSYSVLVNNRPFATTGFSKLHSHVRQIEKGTHNSWRKLYAVANSCDLNAAYGGAWIASSRVFEDGDQTANANELKIYSSDVGAYVGISILFYAAIRLEACYLTKADDWQTLCAKTGVSVPADLATLLADTASITAILASEAAVKYMVAKCTGDFMASFVASSACRSALDASPYKSIVTANKHWSKFLAMVQ